jgi:MFS family permease
MFFGHIADRYGRKPASKAAVWVVLGAIVAQAFNPSGLIHPGMQSLGTAFLLTARVIQGLGVGGIPAAQTWVTELSDKRCLAMTSAMTQASSNTCYCVCAAVLFGLSANLSDADFNLWGWRVGVLLSGAPEVVALIYMDEVMDTFTPAKIDKPVEEDMQADQEMPKEKPLYTVFSKYKTNSLICFVNVTAVNMMQFCCSNMLPYFLMTYCGISTSQAYFITFTSEVSCIWGSLVAGGMSDYFGLGKEAVIGSGIATAYALIAFGVVTANPGHFWPAFILFGPMNAVCSSMACATVQTYVCEAYPRHCRASGTATVNNSSMVVSAAAPVIFDTIAHASPVMVGVSMASMMAIRMLVSQIAYQYHMAGKLRLAHIRMIPY